MPSLNPALTVSVFYSSPSPLLTRLINHSLSAQMSKDKEDEDADANMDDVDREGDIDNTVGSASEGRDPDVST